MLGQSAYDPYAEISTPDIEYSQTREFAPSYTDIVYPDLERDWTRIDEQQKQIDLYENELAAIREPTLFEQLFTDAYKALASPKTAGTAGGTRKPDYTPYLVLGGGAIALVAILAMSR